MEFIADSSVSQSGFVLKAHADDYTDGYPPVNELRVDTPIQTLPAARLAIAGCVAFGSYVGQSVTTTQAIPRMAVEAISRFFSERHVAARPILDIPKSAWPSAGILSVQTYDPGFVPPSKSATGAHEYHLEIADGSLYNGVLSSPHHLVVASNLAVLVQMDPHRISAAALKIAIGVLLSTDLHVHRIHITGEPGTEFLSRCKTLLRSADLSLTWG